MDRIPIEEIQELYEQYREVPLEEWEGMDVQAFGAEVVGDDQTLDPVQIGTATRLYGRLAHQVTLEEFNAALQDNEIPPIKLSPEEMELIRGGVVMTCIAAAGVGVSGYRALKAR